MPLSVQDEDPQRPIVAASDTSSCAHATSTSQPAPRVPSTANSRSSSPHRGPVCSSEEDVATASANEHDSVQEIPDKPSEMTMLQSDSKIEAVTGTPGRSYKENLAGASLSLQTGLLSIYFLYFAAVAFQQDGQPLEGNAQAEWLLDAAAFGPSVFPIVFTAIIEPSATNFALLGIPLAGVPENVNSSFVVQTSYFYLDCSVDMSVFTLRDEATAYGPLDLPGSSFNASVNLYNYTGLAGSGREVEAQGAILRDLTANHRWNNSRPRTIGFQSPEAWCNMTTTYTDARATCYGGAHNCTVEAVRKSIESPCPRTATGLDGVGQKLACDFSISSYTSESFFRQFMNAHAFMYGDSSKPIGEIGPELFSQRFSQLINMYWLVTIAPYAVGGNLSWPSEKKRSSGLAVMISDATPQYGIRATVSSVETFQLILRCHRLWLVILISLSCLLICAGFVSAYLDSCRTGPIVLDDFVSSLRDNPYAKTGSKSSLDDRVNIARRCQNMKVQLGDLRPEDDVGYVAVATPGSGQPVGAIMRRRLCA
ncbi:hypothetical protein CKM354_000625200 [Cercospora kikuchii]|uniref:Uncharacterized protein n=1 Tax=Cercospora kikuchii TaxID=84275 RepID=A0A9P3FD50_9PEZI|nr:uncharacterized protein CKM354_000625200 [Cercospora kikuchii]GIZ43006.1 hypothetical protein CKM354_000625200 [Cercospora kikuchii]